MTKTAHTRKRASVTKQHRIAARVTDEQHALFQRAAAMQGRSLTDFVITTLQEKAVQTIEAMEIVRLNAEESRNLVEALLAPPREPNEYQRAAVADYYRLIRRQ